MKLSNSYKSAFLDFNVKLSTCRPLTWGSLQDPSCTYSSISSWARLDNTSSPISRNWFDQIKVYSAYPAQLMRKQIEASF